MVTTGLRCLSYRDYNQACKQLVRIAMLTAPPEPKHHDLDLLATPP